MLDLFFIEILALVAVLFPIVFYILDTIENYIEKKYGDITRNKFIKWISYISNSILIVAFISVCLSLFFDTPFPH